MAVNNLDFLQEPKLLDNALDVLSGKRSPSIKNIFEENSGEPKKMSRDQYQKIADIRDFMADLHNYHDAARADRFRVIISPPKKLSGYVNSGNSRLLSLRCEQAELPGRTLSTFDYRTYGPNQKSPYQSVYSDLNLTFFCMGNPVGIGSNRGIMEKMYFDDWMEIINPSDVSGARHNFSYKDEYSADIIVEHFDTDGNRTYAAKYLQVFPVSINQIPLAWSDESILKLNVTFAYYNWIRLSGGGIRDVADLAGLDTSGIDKVTTDLDMLDNLPIEGVDY